MQGASRDRWLATLPICLLATSLLAESVHEAPFSETAIRAAVSGVVSDAGLSSGIPGVIVSIRPLPGSTGRSDSIRTDGAGVFQFPNVSSGTYLLEARAQGFIPGRYGQKTWSDSARTLTVGDTEVKGLNILLWRLSSIEGILRLDMNGLPLPKVTAKAYRWTVSAGRRCLVPTANATSDDRGVYRIAGLVPGEYVVGTLSRHVTLSNATQPGSSLLQQQLTGGFSLSTESINVGGHSLRTFGSPVPSEIGPKSIAVYGEIFYPQSRDPATGASIDIQANEGRTGVDLRLTPTTATEVSGRLVDGPPVGLVVHLVSASASVYCADSGFEAAATISSENGEFKFLGVPPGRYLLKIRHVPRPQLPKERVVQVLRNGIPVLGTQSQSGIGFVPLPQSKEPMYWAALPIDVDSRGLTGLVVPVGVGFRIRGRAAVDSGSQSPMPNLGLSVVSVESPRGPTSAETIPAGIGQFDEFAAFETIGVQPGPYLIRVVGLPEGWSLKEVRFLGRDVSEHPLDVTQDTSGLEIILTDRPSLVSGRVQIPAGYSGPANAEVLVFPALASDWTEYGVNPRRLARTPVSADGSYRIEGLPPGNYWIVAVTPSPGADWAEPRRLTGLSSRAVRLRLLAGERLAQDLTLVSMSGK